MLPTPLILEVRAHANPMGIDVSCRGAGVGPAVVSCPAYFSHAEGKNRLHETSPAGTAAAGPMLEAKLMKGPVAEVLTQHLA